MFPPVLREHLARPAVVLPNQNRKRGRRNEHHRQLAARNGGAEGPGQRPACEPEGGGLPMTVQSSPLASGSFTQRLVAVTLVIVAALALWYLRSLLLLVFAAILFAIVLRSLSAIVARPTGLGEGWSFVVATVTAVLAVALFVTVLGAQLQAQLLELRDRLPELLAPVEDWLGSGDVGEWLVERAEAMVSQGAVMSRIAGLSGWAVTLLANVVLVAAAGLYIGYRPGLYRGGLLMLFPRRARKGAAATMDALGSALQRWLLGQLASMVVVGTLIFLGLWAIGIEAALALAFIAGILEFIPFFGPVLAIAPAVALALAVDTSTAIWVFLLYLAVQQFEGNVLNPLIQQQAVSLPPAVTMFALLAFGVLFGPLGVLLATPLAVVCLVVVKQVWVGRVLGEPVSLPGKDRERREQAGPAQVMR